MPALVRLLRPALAPTAAADVLAAAAFVGGAAVADLLGAVVASVCIYMAGMVQNDLVDRKRDTGLHPDRPLVQHPRLTGPAYLISAGLYVAGVAVASAVDLFWPVLGVALLANVYNLGAKRHFPWDAVLLGAARALNLSLGFVAAGAAFDADTITYALSYLLFIGSVTAASRAEDLEPRETRRLVQLLAFLALVVSLGGFASLSLSGRWVVFLVPLAVLLFSVVRAMLAGTREAAMRHVLWSLLTIFLVHACVLWAAGRPAGLLAVIVCAALSFLLLGALSPRAGTPPGSC